MNADLHKTLVIWWRYGKEHSEEGFRVNPSGVIAAHLDQKVTSFCSVPDHLWRWWQAGNLIVERPTPNAYGFGPDTRIYYLVQQGLTVIENTYLFKPDVSWKWYIHLADIFYDSSRECWVNKDLFCDVVVDSDNSRHRVLDLADLGEALKIGLISSDEASEILGRMDSVLKAIAGGAFPFPEVLRGQAICRRLGW